jgi:hypothetical protein
LHSASPGLAVAASAPSKTFCNPYVLCLDGADKKGPRSNQLVSGKSTGAGGAWTKILFLMG